MDVAVAIVTEAAIHAYGSLFFYFYAEAATTVLSLETAVIMDATASGLLSFLFSAAAAETMVAAVAVAADADAKLSALQPYNFINIIFRAAGFIPAAPLSLLELHLLFISHCLFHYAFRIYFINCIFIIHHPVLHIYIILSFILFFTTFIITFFHINLHSADTSHHRNREPDLKSSSAIITALWHLQHK